MSIGKTPARLFTAGLVLVLLQPIKAQDLEVQTKALKAISAFAADTCGNSLALEGQSSNLELSGEIKAQLQGLVAQVAGLGVTGAGKYTGGSYKNVLQAQLADALQNNATCRLKVFELLQEKMIPQH
jgi:hypothetical protein